MGDWDGRICADSGSKGKATAGGVSTMFAEQGLAGVGRGGRGDILRVTLYL